MRKLVPALFLLFAGCISSGGSYHFGDAGVGGSPDLVGVPATCTDGKQDGDETGVDCGGHCAACGSGPIDMAHASTPDLAVPPPDFAFAPQCVSQCFTDGDCQNSCPAVGNGGTNCCDTTTGICFVTGNSFCPAPPSQPDLSMSPY